MVTRISKTNLQTLHQTIIPQAIRNIRHLWMSLKVPEIVCKPNVSEEPGETWETWELEKLTWESLETWGNL